MILIMKKWFKALLICAGIAFGIEMVLLPAHSESADQSTETVKTSTASTGAPKLMLQETYYDFGKVQQGDKVTKKFIFKNEGDSDLVINQVKSSCGCTAAAASTGPFRPGQSGTIEVTYDSRAKIGAVEKQVSIFTNQSPSPEVISIKGIVTMEGHPPIKPGDVLFNDVCAACHAAPAKGRKGAELYKAVCEMCHDMPQNKEHRVVAPNRRQLAQIPKNDLKRFISEGMNSTSMPGYVEAAGGPLTNEQIDSLVKYIVSLKSK